ncbi:MAG: helix-turn-helix domain-containing protein [Blautia sp.]|uniref:helix-turn-helix domain-containing protein n=1 Tax=Blautia sp. TaxID=1955243 RepID=UPI003993B505
MFDEYPDVITVEEAETLLKVSKKTVYKLIKEKKIKARKVGRNYRISKVSLCILLGEEGGQ